MIRSVLILLCWTLSCQAGTAQHRISFTVSLPSADSAESIFIAGDFNGWNPADTAFRLEQQNGLYSITINDRSPGPVNYKFTRGSWERVEVDASGSDIPNRYLKVSGDTVITCSIAGWRDKTPKAPRKSTAGKQVVILPDSFHLMSLNRNRKVRVYLPAGYHTSRTRYPVLYMHDGQNLFDDTSSAAGEWGIDECLDSLVAKGHPPCIVVGIDNGPQRISEYLPFPFENYADAEGDLYLNDLVKVIKPYIDKRFRTLPSRENTLIAGSSLGATISYYALLKRPDVFGHAGLFSPAFWISPQLLALTDTSGKAVTGRCFFYIGGDEGKRFRDDMIRIADRLGEKSSAVLYSVTDPEGRHHEQYWRKWFPEFYTWVMGNGFNRQIDTKK